MRWMAELTVILRLFPSAPLRCGTGTPSLLQLKLAWPDPVRAVCLKDAWPGEYGLKMAVLEWQNLVLERQSCTQ